MVRDLARATVFPRADYGVNSFFPLPPMSIRPLDRVNKSVARSITGGYRSTSLAALEKEAAILPASLRLESSLLHRIARYLTLPPDHGLVPLLQTAISTHPRNPKLATPLHYIERIPAIRWPESVAPRGQRLRRKNTPRDPTSWIDSASIDHSLGMERILPVYAPPWAEPLPVTTLILPKDDALKVLNEMLLDPTLKHSTWFTDGSLLGGRAGGAAVRVEGGLQREEVLIPLGDGQVTEGEVDGVIAGTTEVIKANHDRGLMVSDSQAGLKGIGTTRARSGQYRAIKYDQLLRRAVDRNPSFHIINLWTPAHIGTIGNELADPAHNPFEKKLRVYAVQNVRRHSTASDPCLSGNAQLKSVQLFIQRALPPSPAAWTVCGPGSFCHVSSVNAALGGHKLPETYWLAEVRGVLWRVTRVLERISLLDIPGTDEGNGEVKALGTREGPIPSQSPILGCRNWRIELPENWSASEKRIDSDQVLEQHDPPTRRLFSKVPRSPGNGFLFDSHCRAGVKQRIAVIKIVEGCAAHAATDQILGTWHCTKNTLDCMADLCKLLREATGNDDERPADTKSTATPRSGSASSAISATWHIVAIKFPAGSHHDFFLRKVIMNI
ncbi:hypothetical protein C8R43DRAFT_955251 [Mycena crocata]|nr:hypothetical protein C8R43DRAFT_955251 [Mycena crocata]